MSMIASKRRDTEVFSMAFLDCICCGFGSVLLIFIMTVGQKTSYDEQSIEEVQERVRRLERTVTAKQQEVDQMASLLAAAETQLPELLSKNDEDKTLLSKREKELLLLLQDMGRLKDALAKLLEQKKFLPTEDKSALPIPNVDRRQYLTGMKMEGEFVLFLVRASGSMLDETIDSAVARLGDPDYKKREAPKWQRVRKSLEWLIANLDPQTHFQVFLFNEETTCILPNRGDDWFSPTDHPTVNDIVRKLRTVVPGGSANLERAFTTIRYLGRMPDSIVLITDGLPTMSDSIPGQSDVDSELRIRFFRAAQRTLPARVPVNVILFPMSGDPGAPGLYWTLAINTRGSFVSPSKDWPDT